MDRLTDIATYRLNQPGTNAVKNWIALHCWIACCFRGSGKSQVMSEGHGGNPCNAHTAGKIQSDKVAPGLPHPSFWSGEHNDTGFNEN